MMKKNLEEFRDWIKTLDSFYQKINLGLFSKQPTNKFQACCSNIVNLSSTLILLLFSYLLFKHTTNFDMAAQQAWALLYSIQAVARGVNRIYRYDDMDELVKWFEGLYQPIINVEYQAIIEEQLKLQNQRIKKILRYTQWQTNYVCQSFGLSIHF